jgi:hypothetical protein
MRFLVRSAWPVLEHNRPHLKPHEIGTYRARYETQALTGDADVFSAEVAHSWTRRAL